MSNHRGTGRHYCWMILLACCLVMGPSVGIYTNCAGLFYIPVSNGLDVSMASVTMHITLQNIACCVTLLFADRILKRCRLKLVMVSASLLTALPAVLLSFVTNVGQMYILGILQGIGMAFTTTYVAPIIIRRWFTEKRGTAMGVSSAFCGVFGAVMSVILGWIISAHSWRVGYFVSGLVGLVAMLPVSIWILVLDSADKGMLPYGYDKSEGTENDGSTAKQTCLAETVVNNTMFQYAAIVLLAMLVKVGCSFKSHLTAYGTTVGFSLMSVSVLTTFNMIGNTGLKLAFGPLTDRIGTKRASYLAIAISALSVFMLMTKADLMLCVAAFLFAIVSMFSLTEVPLIAGQVFSKENYSKAMAAINIGSYLSMSICTSVYGLIYDRFGGYSVALYGLLVVFLLQALLVAYLLKRKKATP